ncbi:HNH endonuclease (plasmid) [Halorutilales archaeon Cl-col2-1]
MLDYVESNSPSEGELIEWVLSNTKARSRETVPRHLSFLESIRVLKESDSKYFLGEIGESYLENQDSSILYEGLRSGVKGFDEILLELTQQPMTDEEIKYLLRSEFKECDMDSTGVATRHREWLQVLGFVKRSDDVSQITDSGREILDKLELNVEPSNQSIEDKKSKLREASKNDPQLTEERDEYTQTQRRARDSAFSELVKEAYNETCAVCGSNRESPDGNPEVEAAHIYPKRKNGSDVIQNGIALCRLHHWAFDVGWFVITDDYEIVVRDEPERNGYNEFKKLEGKKINLPDDEDLYPHTKFLEKRREMRNVEME